MTRPPWEGDLSSFLVGRVLRLAENELSVGRLIAEIQPTQDLRTCYPFADRSARLPCVNAADNEIELDAFLEKAIEKW